MTEADMTDPRLNDLRAEEISRKPGAGARGLGAFLYVLSGLIVVVALIVAFNEPRVVGGDAFNMMIAGIRAIVFTVIALILAVAAAGCRIVAAIMDQSRM